MPPGGRMKGIPLLEGGDKSPSQKTGQRLRIWDKIVQIILQGKKPASKSISVTEQPINYRGFMQQGTHIEI